MTGGIPIVYGAAAGAPGSEVTPPIETTPPQPAPPPLQNNISSTDNVKRAIILVSDAIQTLQNGNSTSAISHLISAKQQLTTSNENRSPILLAIILVYDAIQTLQNGNSTSAISHLIFAKQQLAIISQPQCQPPAQCGPPPSGASSGG